MRFDIPEYQDKDFHQFEDEFEKFLCNADPENTEIYGTAHLQYLRIEDMMRWLWIKAGKPEKVE